MNQIEKVSLEEMLEAREDRVIRQNTILKYDTDPLICFTLNIPGPVKTSVLYEDMFEAGIAKIERVLEENQYRYLLRTKVRRKTGYEGYISVCGNPEQIKEKMCGIEDGSAVGRIYDIDVLRDNGLKVSREEIGKEPRKCLICGEQAQVCGRNRTHSVGELTAYIDKINF